MSYEVGVVDSFESAHRLKGNFGPATNLHGHTYRVEVVVGGSSLLERDGTLCDIVKVKEALGQVMRKLHYKVLDDVEELAGVNTTAEQMARFIFSQVFRPLKEVEGSVEYLKVTVWENQSGFASFKDRI